MNYYFSSDWHLNHANILKYDKRPFATVDQMNDTIISNYNSIVTPDDEFYFLGDLLMGDRSKAEAYLQQLNGKKFFISGNHDKVQTINLFKKYGKYLGRKAEVIINKQSITLCHYSLETWNGSRNGSWHLFGHTHGSVADDSNSLSLDMGINIWDYKPVSFEEIERKMRDKFFKPIDNLNNKKT